PKLSFLKSVRRDCLAVCGLIRWLGVTCRSSPPRSAMPVTVERPTVRGWLAPVSSPAALDRPRRLQLPRAAECPTPRFRSHNGTGPHPPTAAPRLSTSPTALCSSGVDRQGKGAACSDQPRQDPARRQRNRQGASPRSSSEDPTHANCPRDRSPGGSWLNLFECLAKLFH